MGTPLSDCGIDDALIEFIPHGDDTFLQLTNVLHMVFGTRIKLLFIAPNFLKHFVRILGENVVKWRAILQSVGGSFFGSRCMLLLFLCRYDPQTNQWSSDVAPTSSCRTSVGVAVLDSHLYAVGGQDGVSCLSYVEKSDITFCCLFVCLWGITCRFLYARMYKYNVANKVDHQLMVITLSKPNCGGILWLLFTIYSSLQCWKTFENLLRLTKLSV